MSTVPPVANATESSGQGLILGQKVLTVVLALAIVVQAALAGSGLFKGNRDLIDGHEMLGNVIFLISAIQVVLAFLSMQKGLTGKALLVTSIITLGLVVAQLGLGYSGRESADAKAWHLPNGVLLMGACTLNLALAWIRPAKV